MSESPFSNTSTLDNNDIANFCKKNNIDANILTLEQFNENPGDANTFCIIFTGNSGNKYNTVNAKTIFKKGKKIKYAEQKLTHHWLGVFADYIFDSYGYQHDFTFPNNEEQFKFVKCFPSRLQEFNSNVCGEYVLSFLHYCKNNINTVDDDVGEDYSSFMNFTIDRFSNDKKVIDWYNENK